MKTFIAALAAVLICGGAALAQQDQAPPPDNDTYNDTNCGAWVNDAWVPNANCGSDVTVIRHASVAGTITQVQGHLVTLQQTNHSLVINDQPALNHQQTGKVAVGRQVVAYGYWRNGTFYATGIY